MKHLIVYFLLVFIFTACKNEIKTAKKSIETTKVEADTITTINYYSLFKNNSNYISNGFDFPIGKPNAKGYYNAQKFGENEHLGDDWNGVGGGNSDLGDAIYAVSNGYIKEAKNYEGGWGNVISIVHLHKNKLYKSMYAHCDTILVKEKNFIKKGDKIATIGNCNGQYYAHLHFEIRDSLALDIGGGYSKNTNGYLDPTKFIKKNRTIK